MILQPRRGAGSKGGSSRARAERAKRGHARRKARALGAGTTRYRGSQRGRAKGSWFWL